MIYDLHLNLDSVDPLAGELIAFTTLTLPVILYFTLSENGRFAGTIGKRKLGLHIVSKSLTKAKHSQAIVNKKLYQISSMGTCSFFFLFRLFYFTSTNKTTPDWI